MSDLPDITKVQSARVKSTWNPWQMFDVSQEEMARINERKVLAEQRRATYRKIVNDPAFVVSGGRGGHLLDPAVQKWNSTRATMGDYFKVNSRNTAFFFLAFVMPIAILYKGSWSSYEDKDRRCRRGEVPSRIKMITGSHQI